MGRWTEYLEGKKQDAFQPFTTFVDVGPSGMQSSLQEIRNLTNSQAMFIVATSVVTFGTGIKVGRMIQRQKFPWTRYKTVQDIPSTYFGPNSPKLRGMAVSVSDGDTFRFLHIPTLFSSRSLDPNEKISEVTLPIRVCTIDTPETAKFGKVGQPYSDEAKEKLRSMIENKIIKIQLLQKDQYSRVVATVQIGRIWTFIKYIDEEMLKSGLAEVYQGSGAVYGYKGKEAYLAIEDKARTSKRGIWSINDRESAKEYKARTKE